MSQQRETVHSVRVVDGGPFAPPLTRIAPTFAPPSQPHLAKLRRRHRLDQIAGDGSDFDRARRIKTWVRSRWDHGYDVCHGSSTALNLLEQATQGRQFQCSHYARVFMECCLALGLPARLVNIQRRESDFPYDFPGNSGHVVAEAYCRELGAWVMFDADLNCHYTRHGRPCSSLGLHHAWHEDRGSSVEQIFDEPAFVLPAECPGVSRRQMRKNFVDFNRHRTLDYYHYVYVNTAQGFHGPLPDGAISKRIAFAGRVHPLTARGFAESASYCACDLTDQPEAFDWPIDRTFLRARMLGKQPSRRVRLEVSHTMPWLSHLELAVGRDGFAKLRRPQTQRADCDKMKLWLPQDGHDQGPVQEMMWDHDPDNLPAEARSAGHEGVDYWPVRNFLDAVLNDETPEMDVYKAAEAAAPAILAAESIHRGSHPLRVPDFRPGPQRQHGRLPEVDWVTQEN